MDGGLATVTQTAHHACPTFPSSASNQTSCSSLSSAVLVKARACLLSQVQLCSRERPALPSRACRTWAPHPCTAARPIANTVRPILSDRRCSLRHDSRVLKAHCVIIATIALPGGSAQEDSSDHACGSQPQRRGYPQCGLDVPLQGTLAGSCRLRGLSRHLLCKGHSEMWGRRGKTLTHDHIRTHA